MKPATREKKRRKLGGLSKQSASNLPPTELSPSGLANWLRPACAFLLGSLIVWSFLAPADATSVFRGGALAQNLFWLLAACCSAAAVAIGQGGFRFSTLAWAAAAISLSWLLIGSIEAGSGNNPRVVWNGVWQLIALAACFFCLRGCLAGDLSRTAAVAIVLAGCLACSLQGLYQVQFEIPANRAAYLENPDQSLQDAGVYAPPGSPARVRFESRLLESNEPYANFALANSLAIVLSSALLISLGLLVGAESGKAELGQVSSPSATAWYRHASFYALLATFLIVFACWLLTRSRAAYAAVVATALSTLLWTQLRRRQRRVAGRSMAMVGLVCALSAVAAISWLWFNDRLVLSEARKSLGYRVEYWQATLRMIADHPWTGVGLGNFQSYYPYYKLATASEEIADPHNWLLDFMATLGVVVGSVLTLFLLATSATGLRGAFTRGDGTSDRCLPSPEQVNLDRQLQRALLMGALVGGTCAGLLLWLLKFSNMLVWILCWTTAGILVRSYLSRIQQMVRARPYWIALGPVAMLIGLLATGSWQASGIAVPFLVLLAASRTPPGLSVQHNRPTAIAAIALPMIGFFVFLYQAWFPAVGAWSRVQDAALSRSASDQVALAESAVAADPLDTDLLGFAAQGYVQIAQEATAFHFPNAASTAAGKLERWLAADSNSFTNWRQAGNMMLDMAAAGERLNVDAGELLTRAVSYYQQAVNRYPSSVELRIQLAAAAAVDRQWSLAIQEIDTAIELSATTPHEDKKLGRHQKLNQGAGDQMVWLPLSGVPQNARAEAPNMVLAEPLIEWIRKQAQSSRRSLR